ncbi:type II secretion system F family protein [Thiomicrospira sp. ALE5]|uniref:type II secretion system F family protein n=1 Tax=Thiomicrospira sp. ALE5 TaxID=748650 RepID=UPI0008F13E6B|nr:type II secretion system F family protein [Thiomicrospira sp. ALE5]SFR52283.1 Type II secretory pathway, component PulF [Thiomicrospira sp. ALE5]
MPNFRFTFTTTDGQVKTEERMMPSEASLRQLLDQQGSVLIRLRRLDFDSTQRGLPGLLHRIKLSRGGQFNCVQLTEDWVALLASGLTVSDSIQTLVEWQQDSATTANSVLGSALQQVARQLNEGTPLDQAWQASGLRFDPTWLLSIRLGMQTAQLADVLCHWLALQHWRKGFRGRLKKLLTYPLIASSILILVLGFMLVWVLPDLIGFLIDMNAPINQATRLMYGLSNLMIQQPWLLLAGVVVTGLVTWLGVKSVGSKRIPYIGRVSLALERAYLMRQLHWLLAAGTTLHDAVGQMIANSPSAKRKTQLQVLHEQLAQGVPMPQAVTKNLDLPRFSQKLLNLAEKTGQLAPVMQQLADYFEAQARQQLDRFEPWIEPMTTLMLGGVVVWMILAILGPVYGMMAHVVF